MAIATLIEDIFSGLNPTYREDAKTDSAFDEVQDDDWFRALVDGMSTSIVLVDYHEF